jgi:hypothetical protein
MEILAPRIQHASHASHVTHDTCYLEQVPRIPTWSDLNRSLAGLGRIGVGGPAQEFPPVYFLSENSSGNALSQNSKLTENLASPIFDFAPPSTLIAIISKCIKIGEIMGGFPNPPTMES